MQATQSYIPAQGKPLSSAIDKTALLFEQHAVLLGACVSVLYFLAAASSAHVKLVWDDELFTLFISGARDLPEMWKALFTGADQHPPSFYLITRALTSVLGLSHITFRLTAMVGFWVMMLCLYKIVADRSSPVYGLAAMVLPVCSNAFFYAFESRGYGLYLGCTSVAILCWLKGSEHPSERRWAAGVALGLAGAVASHYYAVLMLIPFSVGELARWYRTRQIRPLMLLAFAASFVPIAVFLPVIRSAHGYSATFWARPVWWGQPLSFHPGMIQPAVIPLMIAVLAMFWISARNRTGDKPNWTEQRPYTLHEAAFFFALLSLPFAGYLLAVTVTNGYHPRYVLAGVLGLMVMLILGMYRGLRGAPAGGLVLFILLFAFGAFHWYGTFSRLTAEHDNLRSHMAYLRQQVDADIPIMLGEVTVFHKLSFYAPREFATRLIYASDPQRSVRYLRHDTIDRGLLALRPWFPERIEPYEQVLKTHPLLSAYGYVGAWSWLTYALTDDGIDTRLVGRKDARILLDVRTGAATGLSDEVASREQRAFGAFGRPLGGASTLCDVWMNDATCRSLAGQ